MSDAAHWRARLETLMPRYGVPGAALGYLQDSQIVDVAAGVLSRATLVPATPDAVFQIGSITKVWTATLVMQLVDEGLLSLDTPVAEVLPEFAGPEVCVRHLLTHTSGIAGDVYVDTGRGDDCVQRYVARLGGEEFGQVHPVGATYSYCNAGYVLAGRIVEVLTSRTWDTALRERLIAPLGLSATVTLPEEAILHRAAVGHVAKNGSDPEPASTWVLPRCMGPAGLVTARAHDLLTFARMHLDGGRAADGRQLLSGSAAQAMAERQVGFPQSGTAGDSVGLGWKRFDWNGRRVIGHNGGTIGQRAVLRLLPEQGFAAALLTNGGDAAGLYAELFAELFAELTDIAMPTPFTPPPEPVTADATRHAGRYANSGLELEVLECDGGVLLRRTVTGTLAQRAERLGEEPVEEDELVPVDSDSYAARPRHSASWDPVHFYRLPDGSSYLHWLGRAYARIDTPEPR